MWPTPHHPPTQDTNRHTVAQVAHCPPTPSKPEAASRQAPGFPAPDLSGCRDNTALYTQQHLTHLRNMTGMLGDVGKPNSSTAQEDFLSGTCSYRCKVSMTEMFEWGVGPCATAKSRLLLICGFTLMRCWRVWSLKPVHPPYICTCSV